MIDPQHTGFATGLEPIIFPAHKGSVSLILLNLTIPARAIARWWCGNGPSLGRSQKC